ncbi:MAG: AAA family ATPase [Cytophagales bacterium]|nr:AAA family ATPase [Cytophagales bacterium]
MIKKFIKISGTGKFLNYNHGSISSPHRTTDFERINLVYGENGSGKTTLAIILKSLKDNNALLAKKRSFDRTFPQTVEILTDVTPNPKLTFASNVWDNQYPNLDIFDIHFINENIYTGLEIQNTHKKNLFEIIFGQPGIVLKNDIQVLKDGIQNGKVQIRDTIEKIELAIDRAFTAVDFSNLPADTSIDNKIVVKEAAITTAKGFQEIQTKSALVPIPLFNLPFEFLTATSALSQSIDSTSETYLQKFKEHKEHLSMDGKAEEWIKQGYEAIISDTCPFCLQPINETVEIVEAYKQYFNEEYNSLLLTLAQLNSTISTFNSEAQLLQIENKISASQNLIEFWKTHLANPPALTSIIAQQAAIQNEFDAVKTIFTEKSSNPIQSKETTPVTTFQTTIETLNTLLTGFNTDITAYNTKIATLKSSSQPNLTQLELELKKLKAIKKKEDVAIMTLCTNLSTYTQAVDSFVTQKDTKQQSLDTYSITIFTNYTAEINLYLQAFAPYLEIRNLDSGYVGTSKEPMIKYALHINGNEIKFEDTPTHPSFKYSLSEGDKSALALAFFLTKLELDRNIQDKIIVFDDPVSSFDLNRRSTTINKLIAFGQRAKQLFVLTHNIIFACEFWKSANQISLTRHCSKIEFLGNTSCIVEFNIDTETLSSILKDSLAITNYLTNGCLSDQERRSVARCLRPALESYFHLKFFDLVLPTDWLGQFIDKVRASTSTDRFFRLQNSLTELTDIKDYSKKYHHRFNSNSDSEPVNDAELRNYCDRTLKLIQVI